MTEFSSEKLRVFNYLLIILILITTLFLIRNIIGLLTQSTEHRVQNTEHRTQSTEHRMDIMSYSIILEKNPFGKPVKLYPLVAPHDTGTETVRTPSDLILVGTAVGPKEMSYAILELKDGKGQDVFTYGEEVFNYGILTGIESEYITIRQGSDIITITMIDISSRTEIPQLRVSDSESTGVRKIGERDYLIDREKVQHALENPEQILTDARLLPNFQDGKQQGFRVYEVRSGGIYESLGLRNGDILLKINDLDISSPEVAIQAMSALRGMDRINLDIMRRGTRLSLNYQIR